jgi:hypothetical protein
VTNGNSWKKCAEKDAITDCDLELVEFSEEVNATYNALSLNTGSNDLWA